MFQADVEPEVELPEASVQSTTIIFKISARVLCAASRVFETMVRSGFKEGDVRRIEISQFSASDARLHTSFARDSVECCPHYTFNVNNH